jgi:hypothetical protein
MIRALIRLWRNEKVLPDPLWICVVRNYGGRRFTTGNF